MCCIIYTGCDISSLVYSKLEMLNLTIAVDSGNYIDCLSVHDLSILEMSGAIFPGRGECHTGHFHYLVQN